MSAESPCRQKARLHEYHHARAHFYDEKDIYGGFMMRGIKAFSARGEITIFTANKFQESGDVY